MKTRNRSKLFLGLPLAILMAACDSGGGGGGGPAGQTVLVMGDSISGATNYPGVPPWPGLLQANSPQLTMVNRAVAGEKMESGASRIGGQLAAHMPQSVVIFYGSNNAIQGDTATFDGALRAAIQESKAAGVKKVVVCTIPMMYGDRSIYNGRVDALNATIRSVAGSEGAKIANVAGEFGINDEALFPDGLHPNLDGQNIIAATVRGRL